MLISVAKKFLAPVDFALSRFFIKQLLYGNALTL